MVDVVVDDVVDVVDELVDVEAAVVTGVVVVVTDGAELDVELKADDEVEPESGVADLPLLHPAIVRAKTTIGARLFDFTPRSLAREIPIT